MIAHLRSEAKDPDDCIDVMMFAKYLEKIGDHAVNIANWAISRKREKWITSVCFKRSPDDLQMPREVRNRCIYFTSTGNDIDGIDSADD